ncbi:matrix metalloproteinase-23 isoform X1 [Mastacembelus armatus]|uniref:matrix metalloproteinase-23 isoform X1 n=2 Tax=Mastacembelus armatus TaxID=205130 RepID=UPI000E45D0AD|nr:matrix metalloproteinase-23 isoform X1 [Mastacembelus armatus]
MVCCQLPRSLRRGSAPLLAAALLSFLFAGMHQATAFPSWRVEEEAYTTVLLIGIRKEARTQMLHLSRNKRYTLTPEQLKWDKFKLTYKLLCCRRMCVETSFNYTVLSFLSRLLSFPTNLINASDTRRGIAKAFGMWSDVSPFSFREVPADQEADIKIGFYPVNHTDCLQSHLHHCFDGITGELAHAFFPPTGEIHFDDDEYWILGNMRFSWKKGVWLTDLVHVATHEIGHVLGLMHSMDPKAIMHLNATLTGRKRITQDDVWGMHRLYGCLDRLFICPAWARKGYCDSKRKLMQKHCPSSCDFCYEFPFPTVAPTPTPPRTKHKLVVEGKKLTFRCGKKIASKKGKVYWYKDGELLEFSHPNYISLKDDHITIVANAINEGTYTCIVKKKDKVLTNYSWRVRVRF